jgi:hypothetical protein
MNLLECSSGFGAPGRSGARLIEKEPRRAPPFKTKMCPNRPQSIIFGVPDHLRHAHQGGGGCFFSPLHDCIPENEVTIARRNWSILMCAQRRNFFAVFFAPLKFWTALYFFSGSHHFVHPIVPTIAAPMGRNNNGPIPGIVDGFMDVAVGALNKKSNAVRLDQECLPQHSHCSDCDHSTDVTRRAGW